MLIVLNYVRFTLIKVRIPWKLTELIRAHNSRYSY